MTIFKGSRYEYSVIDFVATNQSAQQHPIVFYYTGSFGLVTYREHVYVQGERLDQLANTYYKNPEYWWIIPEYNPQIEDFTNISPGTIIRMPNV